MSEEAGEPRVVQWHVEGYRRIKVSMVVTASTRREAISKALNGDYTDVDTEPDGDIASNFWTARRISSPRAQLKDSTNG